MTFAPYKCLTRRIRDSAEEYAAEWTRRRGAEKMKEFNANRRG